MLTQTGRGTKAQNMGKVERFSRSALFSKKKGLMETFQKKSARSDPNRRKAVVANKTERDGKRDHRRES